MRIRSGRFLIIVLCALSWPMMSGCVSTVAKVGLNEVAGGRGQLIVIQSAPAGKLGQYEHVKLERFGNRMGSFLPVGALTELRAAILDELLKEPCVLDIAGNDTDASDSTLIIRGEVVYYSSAGGVSAMLGNIAQLICQVELVDGPTGAVIGRASCSGASKAIARAGVGELSQAVAKSLVGWLRKNHPDRE